MTFSIPAVAFVVGIITCTDAIVLKMKYLQLQPFKIWYEALQSKNNNIFKFLSHYFYEQINGDLKSIEKETLNVTVSQKMPYVIMTGHSYETQDYKISGYIGDLWHELEDVLHFRTKFTVEKEIMDERAMLRNSTDNLILNPILVRSGDPDQFDRTMPIAVTWYQLAILKPFTGSSFFYMSIFTNRLMATYLATMIVLTFILWFTNLTIANIKLNIELKEKKVEEQYEQSASIDRTFMASFLTILGTHTNQGIQSKAPTMSLRLIILISTLFGFVLIQSYSAILLSQLAIKEIPSQIDIKDLPIKMQHRSLCVPESSIIYKEFMENSSTETKHKWRPILNRPPCTVGQNIIPIQDYCNEKTMVLESQHNTNYIRNTVIFNGGNASDCNFYIFRRRYTISYISLLTKKGFRYANLISIYLLKFHSSGIIKKYQETWFPNYSVQNIKVQSNEAIKFAHMKDLLLLYLLAPLIALIVLLIEIIFHIKSSYIMNNNKLIINTTRTNKNV